VNYQVEKFNNKLMLKQNELEKTHAEVHRLLKDGHVTEQIRQKKRITEELDRHDADKLDDCKLADPPVLIHTRKLLLRKKNKFVRCWLSKFKHFLPGLKVSKLKVQY